MFWNTLRQGDDDRRFPQKVAGWGGCGDRRVRVHLHFLLFPTPLTSGSETPPKTTPLDDAPLVAGGSSSGGEDLFAFQFPVRSELGFRVFVPKPLKLLDTFVKGDAAWLVCPMFLSSKIDKLTAT